MTDETVRYYLYPCDPTYSSGTGHLMLENVLVRDTLPAGVEYGASAGGVHDAATNTVTWENRTLNADSGSCIFGMATEYWVDVVFPSTVFGGAGFSRPPTPLMLKDGCWEPSRLRPTG